MSTKRKTALKKLAFLGEEARFEVSDRESGGESDLGRPGEDPHKFIYRAAAGKGPIPILKILLTNACDKNCLYCANRCSRSTKRYSFQPGELARLFHRLREAGKVSGIFLSSGIPHSPEKVMGKMLKTVEAIRFDYGFQGYIHLKILPQVSFGYVKRAAELADRLSINLEAPNQARLNSLTPDKEFDSLLRRMNWIDGLSQKESLPAGYTTQFVIGAAGETDREILSTVGDLRDRFSPRRSYFSPFRPVEETPLDGLPPAEEGRERRLYRADFLLRDYGFKLEDIPFREDDSLAGGDPKQAAARTHPEWFPVEVNRARKKELLRVPGIGPKSAQRVISMRKEGKIRSLNDLKGSGAIIGRCAPYILINGKRPQEDRFPDQLPLWN